ncbi:MAG: hypothetical protein K9I95_08975 [Flavobacteriaceae bacterium]|jgi:hypothetical protein|nr:hypothetical protein [Flavobacteriaceae bacterium]
MNTVTHILEKISQAKELDFGDIFNKSFELFKKSWLYGFLFQLIVFIIILPFIIVLYVPFVMSIITQSKSGNVDPDVFGSLFSGFTGLYLVFFVLGILAVTVFQLALQAGFFRIVKNIDHDNEVQISDLFYFLKGKYFGRVTLLTFSIILISIIAALLCYLPLIYAMIPLSFITIVFAFNSELSISDIVKISFSLGTKKWLISFGLFIVTYILVVFLTLLTCGIGSLFLSPFIYLPLYFIYKQVIGFDEIANNEIL